MMPKYVSLGRVLNKSQSPSAATTSKSDSAMASNASNVNVKDINQAAGEGMQQNDAALKDESVSSLKSKEEPVIPAQDGETRVVIDNSVPEAATENNTQSQEESSEVDPIERKNQILSYIASISKETEGSSSQDNGASDDRSEEHQTPV